MKKDINSFEYFEEMCDCWSREELLQRCYDLCKEIVDKSQEIERLKEEYVLLQNASEEYENELKERESELEGRIQKAIDYLENAVPFRYFELRDILIYGEIRNNER